MFERTVSPDDLIRLKAEREAADAAYNRALSSLDAAVRSAGDAPAAPPGYDDAMLPRLNESWDLRSLTPPPGGGLKGRLGRFVWTLVAPLFDRQHEFNASLIDHLNRNARAHEARARCLVEVAGHAQDARAALTDFEARLIEYAQQLTPYVDTKDREVAGIMRRINEDVSEVNRGLAATVRNLGDELRLRWESTLARERRLEGRMDELRTSAATAHQAAQTLTRELRRREAAAPDDAAPAGPAGPATDDGALDDYKYVGFENTFRGAPEDIRRRLESYLSYFDGASDVLDVGCGRGEFLTLLTERGVTARGIDLNHEMVEVCRAQGLRVEEVELGAYLDGLPDGALGGLFAAQVVEHLEPRHLMRALDRAFHTLRPGSRLVLETINVTSWSAFFSSYLRDVTHVRPLHPDTLRYLVTASGFQDVEVVYRSPTPAEHRLAAYPGQAPGADLDPSLAALVVAFDENVEKLNRLLFADQDYAVVATRG